MYQSYFNLARGRMVSANSSSSMDDVFFKFVWPFCFAFVVAVHFAEHFYCLSFAQLFSQLALSNFLPLNLLTLSWEIA